MKRPDLARRTASLVAVVAALLGLSGCFKASQDVKVKADGSGAVRLHVDLDKRALATLIRSFGNVGGAGPVPGLTDPFKPVDRTFPDGTKVRAVDSADRATLDASFDFEGADEYRRKMQQVSQAISNNPDLSLPDDGTLRVQRNGNRVEVALEVGSSLAGAGDVDFAALSGLLDPAALPQFVVTITMPGSILSTNGKASGRTVTWDLLNRTTPATLTASSTAARPGLPAWAVPAGVGLAAVLLLGLVGLLVSQRRRPAAEAGPQHAPAWDPVERTGTATFFPPAPEHQAGWPTPPPPVPPPPPPPAAPEPPWPGPPAARPAAAADAGPPAAADRDPSAASPGAPPPPASGSPVPAPDTLEVPVRAAEPTTVATPTAATVPGPAPEPGWYADPAGGDGWRFWDGASWTSHTSSRTV